MTRMILFIVAFFGSVAAILGQNNSVTTHVVLTNTTIVCTSPDIDALYQTNIELKNTMVQMWNSRTAQINALEGRLSRLSNCSGPETTNSTVTPPIPRLEEKIYQNLTINENWTLIYDRPYSYVTTSTDLLNATSSCSNQILVGARRNLNDPQLAVAAVGPVELLHRQTTSNTTVKSGDVYWYSTKGFSVGFSPSNMILQNQADTLNSTSEFRLSWHLDRSAGGGYRAGSVLGLNNNTIWRKIIYCLN